METVILNSKGQEAGKMNLPDSLFGEKPNPHFLHEAVTMYLSNRRSGNHATKTRSDVSGGGHKPWKQKGTGRARAGSTRSPLWRKGGVIFGPHKRSHRKEMPEAKRRLALAQALSAKYAEGNVMVLDFAGLQEAKTKFLCEMLRTLKTEGRVLIVSDKADDKLKIAGQNIPGFSCCRTGDINAYEILNHKKAIFTKDAVDSLSALWKEGKKK